MNNSKKTRKALLSSVVALMLCFSMFVGTTMAWFTDTATTGVNTIVSGTLDVALEDTAGNTLEGKVLKFRNAQGSEDILWEPGATFELDEFCIVNNGNLALEYQIIVTGLTGTADTTDVNLLDVIAFTAEDANGEAVDLTATYSEDTDDVVEGSLWLAPGASTGAITITGHMDEEAGNEYQGLTATGASITVYAAQEQSEYDSFGNTYDAGAKYSNEKPLATVKVTGPQTGLGYLDVDFGNLTNTTVATDKINLDFSYAYKATQTAQEAADSGYENWLADFRITTSRDVAEGEVYLAGQYDGWAELWGSLAGLDADADLNWIQLTGEMPANTPTTLLDGMVTYGELIAYNTTFNCGGYATSALADDLTITVELILTDGTDTIVVNTQTYTFAK